MKIIMVLLVALHVSSACAGERYLPTGRVVLAPIGWIQFCGEHPQECATPAVVDLQEIQLNTTTWNHLVAVNNDVNARISPATDLEVYGKDEYWTYPIDRGDCEDYVLLKRRLLMEAGWPREALLITVVRDRGEGHAVLTVRTDRGEFILDNQVEDILPWYETGYRFVKIQSRAHPFIWVAVDRRRVGRIAAH